MLYFEQSTTLQMLGTTLLLCTDAASLGKNQKSKIKINPPASTHHHIAAQRGISSLPLFSITFLYFLALLIRAYARLIWPVSRHPAFIPSFFFLCSPPFSLSPSCRTLYSTAILLFTSPFPQSYCRVNPSFLLAARLSESRNSTRL